MLGERKIICREGDMYVGGKGFMFIGQVRYAHMFWEGRFAGESRDMEMYVSATETTRIVGSQSPPTSSHIQIA